MRIAVFVSTITSFDRQVGLARDLQASGEDILFVFPQLNRDLAHRVFSELSDWNFISPKTLRIWSKLGRPWLKPVTLLHRIINSFGLVREISSVLTMKRLLDDLGEKFSPEVAIFDLDNRFGLSYVGSRLRKTGVPYFVIPGWFADERELLFAGQYKKANSLRSSIAKFLVFESAVLETREAGEAIPFSVSVLLLRKLMGYLPPQPWILHSGFSEKMLCESEAHRKLGIAYGLETSRLEVTGSVLLSSLNSELRVAAQTESRNSSKVTQLNRPAVLLAIPYQPGRNFRKPTALASDYSRVLEKFLSLEESFPQADFIWNLHPSLDRAAFVELLAKKKTSFLSERSIVQDLARSSTLVGCGSSVLAWGLALGMPVGNWDVYGMGYGDYELSDHIYSKEWDGLEWIVKKALSKDFVKDGQKAWQFWEVTKNPEWGVVDSDANVRITSAINTATL